MTLVGRPEARAREKIDRQLTDAGWTVQDRAGANIHAAPGIAIREFPLRGGPVDYLLYVDGAAAGAVEAKKEGWTLAESLEVATRPRQPGVPGGVCGARSA